MNKHIPFGTKTSKISDYINENLNVTIDSKNGYKLETTLFIDDILSLKNRSKPSRKNSRTVLVKKERMSINRTEPNKEID